MAWLIINKMKFFFFLIELPSPPSDKSLVLVREASGRILIKFPDSEKTF